LKVKRKIILVIKIQKISIIKGMQKQRKDSIRCLNLKL
jgi:hypothetical protein